MARLVGTSGRVIAYEPTSSTRALLSRSRAANNFNQLDIRAFALSDTTRMGFLAFGASGELNALGEGTSGETVAITSLDAEATAPGWRAPDFIKIDAEGEEERILKGAKSVLTTHSPLVMFELKAGSSVNTASSRPSRPSAMRPSASWAACLCSCPSRSASRLTPSSSISSPPSPTVSAP